MDLDRPLSQEEFKDMVALIKRYAETSMDQWEAWKVDSTKGPLYIELKLSNIINESAYIDLSELLK